MRGLLLLFLKMSEHTKGMRVLLVFDDYQEMTTTETYLKKVGFDVVGIMNEMSISDQILAFNPEVLIVNGKGAKVSSFSVGKKLKESIRYDGKVILVVPKNMRPDPSDLMRMKMDSLMEAPIQSERLIQLLGKYSGLSADVMLEKLRKARLSDPELNRRMTMVSGKAPALFEAPSGGSQRASKYAKIIAETHIESKQTSFEKGEIKKRQDEMKKSWDFDTLEEIDKLKKEFAAALFKKK